MDISMANIKLDLSENIFGFSDVIRETLKKEIQLINLYPDTKCTELTEAISKYFGVAPGQISIGNGLDEIILSVAISKKYKSVLIPEHCFMGYFYSSEIAGSEIHLLQLENYKVPLEKMYGELDNVNAIYLCNPQNPFGTVLKYDEIEDLIRRCEEKNVDLILDEAYMDFAEGDGVSSALKLINKYKNLYVLRTFSKAYSLAGLRCGFLVSAEENIADLAEVKKALPFNVNRLAQKAACCALSDDSWVKKNVETCRHNRDLFMKKLKANDIFFVESKTNFVTIYIENADEVCQSLCSDYHIMVKNLRSMGLENYLRIGIGTEEQMDHVISVISGIRNKGEK